MPRCDTCGYLQWPPAPVCSECLGGDFTWVDLAGTGVVWSVARYVRSMSPAHPDVPYSVALVQLDDGPRMLARLQGETTAAIGDRVTVAIDPGADEGSRVRWGIAGA